MYRYFVAFSYKKENGDYGNANAQVEFRYQIEHISHIEEIGENLKKVFDAPIIVINNYILMKALE